MEAQLKPVIVIVGPTASGKSALAINLARKYNGEIIAADSRTIFSGMDIGTAKPTTKEKGKIPHFGIDIVEPNTTYSAVDFKNYAKQKVREIHARQHLPIIVGGTGLYIDGYVFDFKFGKKVDAETRKILETMDIDSLQKLAAKSGIGEDQVNFKNPRHLARAIERGGVISEARSLPENILLLGLNANKAILNDRIVSRVDKMLSDGLVDEVKNLVTHYGSEAPGLASPGYKEIIEYLNGSLDLEQAKIQIIKSHRYLAKRQLTWFKRNNYILWIEDENQVVQYVDEFLRKFDTINA